MKRVLAWLLTAVCAAALLLPLAGMVRETGDAYESTGRALVYPIVAMPEGTVSVNTADLYELIELPGVGETIGQRIIDERESGGYFYYPEDLLAVRGIGAKTLAGMLDLLDMSVPEDGD